MSARDSNLNRETWSGHPAGWWRERLGVPDVHIYKTTDSTNDAARQLAENGADSLTVVVTDRQTRGRGRSGRSWTSTPGASLICSIVFRTHSGPLVTPGAAPVRIGNAVATAIERVSGVRANLKWPNDVVIEGHGKVAGILCESALRQQGSVYVIAGIGINVGRVGEQFTSLSQVAGAEVSHGDLLVQILEQLRPFSETLTQPLSPAERAAIATRDILVDRQVQSDDGAIGIARGINADGSLQLQIGDELKAVHNASIRLAESGKYPGAHP